MASYTLKEGILVALSSGPATPLQSTPLGHSPYVARNNPEFHVDHTHTRCGRSVNLLGQTDGRTDGRTSTLIYRWPSAANENLEIEGYLFKNSKMGYFNLWRTLLEPHFIIPESLVAPCAVVLKRTELCNIYSTVGRRSYFPWGPD